MLCNVYLHRLDRVWQEREHGVLIRYCDDAVVMCKSRPQAEAALARLREVMAELGMQLKESKTRIVHLEVGGEGLTFLGFDHRMVRSPARMGRRQVTFLARWPSDKAMQRARDRLRELTARSRFRIPVEPMTFVWAATAMAPLLVRLVPSRRVKIYRPGEHPHDPFAPEHILQGPGDDVPVRRRAG